MKRNILSFLIVIFLLIIANYYWKQESATTNEQCSSKVSEGISINQNGIEPCCPFFIKI